LSFNVVKHGAIWQTSPPTAMQPQEQNPAADATPANALPPEPVRPALPRPREIGGRDGPDPTRFGDWEKDGRCIDF
jgi:hypothetical protein